MDTMSWTEQCHSNPLRLRAACNEALPPAARPIKPRVVQRLVASAEAADVYTDVAAGLSETPVDDRAAGAFAALVADARWRTLVVEHVQQEQRWTDLWDGAFATAWDWFGALLQKPTDKAHPAARVVTLVLMSACTVGVTLEAAKQLEVELPIRAQFTKEAELKVNAPVQLSLAAGQTTIPVVLETAATKLPIQISTEPGGPVLQSLADFASEARLGNHRLKTATDRIRAVALELRGTNARLAGDAGASVAGELQSLSESLGTVRASVGAGLETAQALRASVQTIDGKLTEQKRDTRELTEHARDWQTSARVVKLSAGQSELVPLWLPTETNGGAGCGAEVMLARLEKKQAWLSVTPRGCPAAISAPEPFPLEKGKSRTLGDLRLVATVTNIHRRWFGKDVVSVRLSSVGRSWASN